MDNLELIPLLQEAGREYAGQHVRLKHEGDCPACKGPTVAPISPAAP